MSNKINKTKMKQINFSDLHIYGELEKRIHMNFDRLEREEYQPENIFMKEYSWPGDFEGRSILALVLLAQATHRQPLYLEKIMEELPLHLNEKGYFGQVLPDGLVDEQQLSGHSWFLRAMVEYYLWKKDENVLRIIQNVTENLVLRAKGYYEKYPVSPDDRVSAGEAMGSLYNGTVGNWYLSTDVGCAFILLDGATHAYQVLKNPELKALIEEMIEKFLAIDILALSFQTHATLSACRGILRYYELTGEARFLACVENIFSLYLKEGITENYANYNWFNRPEWTEPCAVIDSFVLAEGLWENTGEQAYLEYAHNIFYNAISYGQRPNGGFGCDICSGARDEFLTPRKDLYEAYWCCSMRGGEGLSRAVKYSCFVGENEIVVPFYNDSTSQFTFDDGKITLRQITGYPEVGKVRFEVISSDSVREKVLKLFIPSWTPKETVKLTLNEEELPVNISEEGFVEIRAVLKTGTTIQLNFEISIRTETTINVNSIKGYHSIRHGFLMLGTENCGEPINLGKGNAFKNIGNGCYEVSNNGVILKPIKNIINASEEEVKQSKMQILFRD